MIPVKGQHGGLLIAFNGGKSWRLQLLKKEYDQIVKNLARRERYHTVYSLTYRH